MQSKKVNICQILFIISIFLIELANYGQNIIFVKPISSYLV